MASLCGIHERLVFNVEHRQYLQQLLAVFANSNLIANKMAPNNRPNCTPPYLPSPLPRSCCPPRAPASPQRSSTSTHSSHTSPRSTTGPLPTNTTPPSPPSTLMRLLVGVVPTEHSAALGLTDMSPADGQQRPTSTLLTSSSSEVEVRSGGRSGEERLLRPRELEPEEGRHATGKQFVASVPSES